MRVHIARNQLVGALRRRPIGPVVRRRLRPHPPLSRSLPWKRMIGALNHPSLLPTFYAGWNVTTALVAKVAADAGAGARVCVLRTGLGGVGRRGECGQCECKQSEQRNAHRSLHGSGHSAPR